MTFDTHLPELTQPVKGRTSSFKGTGFAKLAQTEEDEKELQSFFNKEKLFIVLTNAGKPVYSS